jgi:hypothetical protein
MKNFFNIKRLVFTLNIISLLNLCVTNIFAQSSNPKVSKHTTISEGRFVWKVNTAKEIFWRHQEPVTSLAFSPDGRYVITGSADKTAVLRDVLTGNTVQTWRHESGIESVAFSPDGRYVITGSADKTAILRDVLTGNTVQTWRHQETVCSLTFSPDSRYVITGSVDKTAVLRDVLNGNTVQTWVHEDSVCSLAFSPDGRYAITGSYDGKADLLDLKSNKTVYSWSNNGSISSVAFSRDGQYVITSSYAGVTVIRDVHNGKTLQTWSEGAFKSITFSPDGRYAITGSWGGIVDLRDVQTGKSLRHWRNKNSIISVSLSPDGRYVATGSSDNTITLHLSGLSTQSNLQNLIIEAMRDAENIYHALPDKLTKIKLNLEKTRPIKDEFESSTQFNSRVANWNQEVTMLNEKTKEYYANLGSLPLILRVAAFEKAINKSYGNPILQDIRYDPEEARFFATLKASNDPEFKRTVSIEVPNDQARSVKQQLEVVGNVLEVELRVTEKNELIWGSPKVKINGQYYIAQYTDKDFISPLAHYTANSTQFQSITPPPIMAIATNKLAQVSDDPNIAKLQTEVMRKEREQKELAARQAEEKRLKEKLAELNRSVAEQFNDDLPSLLSKLQRAKSNPNLYVLAVGINDYADVPDVPFADRSAKQFAELTQALMGAQRQNVIVLTDADATSGRLRGRLRTLLNRLAPQDQLLFYYAGHGVPSRDGTSTYLLAQDGGPGSYEEPDLKLSQIYSAISQSKVGMAKIFIDACFSGRSTKDKMIFEGIAPILIKPNEGLPDSQRLAVITAGRSDQFSNQYKDRGHRLFSYHLMHVLLEDGFKQEITQVHKKLRGRVLNDSRRMGPEFEQEPEFFGNGNLTVSN